MEVVLRDIDDYIDQLIEDIDFDALKHWCAILGVDYEEPPLDDMYPDWECELRTEIGEEMLKWWNKLEKQESRV